MSETRHPKDVSKAGKKLADPSSSKKEKSAAGKKLQEHKEKRH